MRRKFYISKFNMSKGRKNKRKQRRRGKSRFFQFILSYEDWEVGVRSETWRFPQD
jgi:hypothetical protein